MKRLLQSLLIGAGVITAGFFAQAAVRSALALKAPVATVAEADLGTEENPYTVGDIVARKAECVEATKDKAVEKNVWVEGYIAGCIPNNGKLDDAVTDGDEVVDTNIVLVNDASRPTKFIPVQLPKAVREALNIKTHPDNVGKHVKLYGDIQLYFTEAGFKNVSKYEFIEAAASIDYANFMGVYMDEDENEDYFEFTEDGDGYISDTITFSGIYFFYLQKYSEFFMTYADKVISENNLSCDFYYIDIQNMDPDLDYNTAPINPAMIQLEGDYKVKVVYEGEKATVTFISEGAPVGLDYTAFNAVYTDIHFDETTVALEEVGEKSYKSVEPIAIEKGFFSIVDSQNFSFGVPEDVEITESNLSATMTYLTFADMIAWPEEDYDNMPSNPLTLNLEGNYNLSIEYSGKTAKVTFEAAGDAPAIDYSEFMLMFEGDNKEELELTSLGGNSYKSEPILFKGKSDFVLGGDMDKGDAFLGDVNITADQLEGTLTLTNMYTDQDAAYPTVTLNGTYEVFVNYAGNTANVKFVAVETPEPGIDYSMMVMNIVSEDDLSGESDVMATFELVEGTTYKSEEDAVLKGVYNFGILSMLMNGDAFAGDVVVTDAQPQCELKYYNIYTAEEDEDLGTPMLNLNGTYEIYVTYDGDIADVYFKKVAGGNVELDYANFYFMYMPMEGDSEYAEPVGEGNDYKFENIEFNGETMFMLVDATSEGRLMFIGETEINDDNLSCTLEYVNMDEVQAEPACPMLNLTGSYNVYVVYEGQTANVTFEKAATADVSDYVLKFETSGEQYFGYITDDGILFSNVKLNGEDMFFVYDFMNYDPCYGSTWTEDVMIDEDNLVATLPNTSASYDFLPANVNLTGIYNVLMTNVTTESVKVAFTKVADLYSPVQVSIEDGMSFGYKAESFTNSEVTVATEDQYFNITGYTLNGKAKTLDKPEASVTVPFEVGAENVFVFTVEYTGTIKALDETTDVAEFEGSNIQIKRVNGKIEIKNMTPGNEVVVYTLGGQIVGAYKANFSNMTLELEKGQYIVRVADVAAKVIL